MDGVASFGISHIFVSAAFNVRKVFFEAGIKRASSFTDVELSSSGAINDVYNVVRQAVELFREFREYFN